MFIYKNLIQTWSCRNANLLHNQVNLFANPLKTIADYSI